MNPHRRGPFFRNRDADPVPCAHCARTVRRDDLNGVHSTGGRTITGLCDKCATHVVRYGHLPGKETCSCEQ